MPELPLAVCATGRDSTQQHEHHRRGGSGAARGALRCLRTKRTTRSRTSARRARIGRPSRTAQVSSQLAGCLVALFWIFRQALEDDRLQVARQTRAELSGPGRLIADDLPDHSLRRGRIKHRAPRGQLVERGTEAVEIATLIDRAFERFGLLRTHVSRRPHEAPRTVSVASSSRFARPKSVSQTTPSGSSRRFDGLMSRWITPR